LRHDRHEKMRPKALSSSSLTGDSVVNEQGEDLGKIEEIMIDLHSGQVAYCVLSIGGFLGMGDKLFAIPWQAMTVDTDRKVFVLNVDKETLKMAPGFDKNNWPQIDAEDWLLGVYNFYGYEPYWRQKRSG
jgi:sporulation protein YlmC with PRC-barrel domain